MTAPREFPDTFDEHEPDVAEAVKPTKGKDKKNGKADLSSLILLDAALLEGQPMKPRLWVAHHRIPAGNVTLLNGDGASGKTTIGLQLCCSTALGPLMPDWLGSIVDMPGPAIFLSAEEDIDEIHRRLDAILSQRGLSFRDLDHKLHFKCMPGEDCVLGAPNRLGVIQPTKLFNQLALTIENIRPSVVVLEAAADLFSGNENDRVEVRQFIALLRRPAITTGAAVLLIQHPSLSGLASGSGTSGSTGWNNSVRSRLNFTAAKPTNGDDPDPDLRELQVKKSNYGPPGETVRLRWQRGVFVPDGVASPTDRAAAEAPIDDAFMKCLDAVVAQGRTVSDHNGKNHAPTIFEKMPEAKGQKSRALDLAMARLFSAKRIRVDTIGPPSKRRSMIVRV